MYEAFARVYDAVMDEIPYDEWCVYLRGLLEARGVSDGIVCELGCGTGNVTQRLCAAGYDMIGIDASEEMLSETQEKLWEGGGEQILYLNQDIREFELFGTVRAFVSVCDTMNYMVSEEDLLKVFRLVSNYLDEEGVFIFDMKTAAYFEGLGNRSYTDVREDCALIWENEYDAKSMTNTYALTIFEEAEDGLYERSDEVHVQRAYGIERVKELLREAGLKVEACYEAFTDREGKEENMRVYFIAREVRHEGKLYT